MRRAGWLAVVAALTLGLSGCWWGVPGQNADGTSFNGVEQRLTPETVGGLVEVWRRDNDWPVSALKGPVSVNGRVYVSVGGCGVAAFAASDGATLWEGGPPDSPCMDGYADYIDNWTAPFVAGDTVLAGWTALLPINPRDPVLMSSLDAYDAATGAPVSTAVTGSLPAMVRGDRVMTQSMVVNRLPPPYPPIFVSWAPGILDLSSLSGAATTRTASVGGVPTLGASAMFIYGQGPMTSTPGDTASGPGLRAFPIDAPTTGCAGGLECPSWVTDAFDGRVTQPVLAPDQGTAFVISEAGTVYAVDTADGTIRWSVAAGSGVTSRPALAHGVLYVGTTDGRLVAVDTAACDADPAGCAVDWQADGNGVGIGQPVVGGDVVYTATSAGDLAAYDAGGCDAASCTPLWTGSAGAALSGGPIVSDGRLLMTVAPRTVVAFGLPA